MENIFVIKQNLNKDMEMDITKNNNNSILLQTSFKGIIGVLIFVCMVFMSTNTYSQCTQGKFCDKKSLGDYDYNGQSSFAMLAPGDTSKTSVILYGNQNYRIMVCYSPNLGDVTYTVAESKKTVKKILKQVIEVYPEEEETSSDESYNDEDNYNENGENEENQEAEATQETKAPAEPTYDTIWESKTEMKENIVFNSENSDSGANYYEISPKTTKRFIIKVVIPEGDVNNKGCVSILVGRKEIGTKRFAHY